jgi:hypothetical protein
MLVSWFLEKPRNTGRQRDVDGPARFSSLTLERKEHPKMNVTELDCEVMDYIDFLRAFIMKVMNVWVTHTKEPEYCLGYLSTLLAGLPGERGG